VPVGAELLLSYADVLTMIDVACAAGIAVLGVEAFQVDPSGVRPLEYSSYEVHSTADWTDFVCQNAEYARGFVKAHALGEEHGYLLTATSEDEFRETRIKA